MCNARAQGSQERSPRRNRYLARRGIVVNLVALFAIIVIVQAFAFIVWDVGTRAPEKLFRDVAAGFRRGASTLRGVRAFILGAVATAVAQLGLGLAERNIDSLGVLLGIEILVVCAALVIEMMIGPLVRARLASRERAPVPPQ